MAAKAKILKNLRAIYIRRDTAAGVATTVNTAIAIGASTFVVTSAAGITSGMSLRIGSNEEQEDVVVNGAPAGTTVTVHEPFTKAHAVAETVTQQTVYDVGDPEGGGVSVDWAGAVGEVNVITRQLVFQRLTGFISVSCNFTLPSFDLYTFAHAVAARLTKITGTGTTADPRQFVTDGLEFNEDEAMSVVAVGVAHDGSIMRAELWGVAADYTGINFALTRGALAGVPLALISSGGGKLAEALPFATPSTALKPGKGKVWNKLTEAGYFAEPGTATTTDGAIAAGANSVTVDSATGIAAGAWIKLGSGENAEHVQVHAIAGLVLTLRHRTLRAHADATAVKLAVPTKFAGIGPAGVGLAVGGSVTPINAANHPINIGVRSGAVSLALTFPVLELSLEGMARALGIPAADVSGGILPFGENISTGTIEGVYLRGVLKDGTPVIAVGSGCEVDVSAVSLLFNNAGDPPPNNLVVTPTSALLMAQG